MFVQAKEAGVDMMELGERLAEPEEELMAEYEENGIPTPQTRSMTGVKLEIGQPVSQPVR
jgi:hypothetical protein